MSLFDQAKELIAKVVAKCPKTEDLLMDALKGLQAVSCAADGVGKDDAFAQARKLLANALDICPDAEDEIASMVKLLDSGMTVKCSGG